MTCYSELFYVINCPMTICQKVHDLEALFKQESEKDHHLDWQFFSLAKFFLTLQQNNILSFPKNQLYFTSIFSKHATTIPKPVRQDEEITYQGFEIGSKILLRTPSKKKSTTYSWNTYFHNLCVKYKKYSPNIYFLCLQLFFNIISTISKC